MTAVQYTGQAGVMIADETDPWLQRDGSVIELDKFMALLPPGPCGECACGWFAPTGNGPTEQGVERCDQCNVHDGDLAAALALATLLGAGATVWFEPEDDPLLT